MHAHRLPSVPQVIETVISLEAVVSSGGTPVKPPNSNGYEGDFRYHKWLLLSIIPVRKASSTYELFSSSLMVSA